MKEKIYVIIFIIALVCGGLAFIHEVKAELETQAIQEKKAVEEYKQCILDQSESHGWVVRSSCSNNYKILDTKANLEYVQKGTNIYLKK